ncbi:MAG: hypothetical protein JRG89_16925 [Deltaproteobacteria bacterium]|nr:hypothetical protein [Deltaproteobacteria bacterium]MBW2722900.1 hypothetical protein [Deltaproteobacteria bacterium]
MAAAVDAEARGLNRKKARFQASWLMLTAAICTGLILWGGVFREYSNLIAEEGLGYSLGIAGMAMMTLLLTYSFRKRMPVLLGRFSIRRWFEIHMMLGLAGPTAILFHCNFHLGSLNSTIALISMLLVSASGIAGRFMYTRIHHGLLGDRATLGELHQEIADQRLGLSMLSAHGEGAAVALVKFEKFALAPRKNALVSTARFMSLPWRVGSVARTCRRAASKSATASDHRIYRFAIQTHLRSVRRAAEFSTYAWLFSLWHALHLPLCVLLFAAAAIHVLAVNLY